MKDDDLQSLAGPVAAEPDDEEITPEDDRFFESLMMRSLEDLQNTRPTAAQDLAALVRVQMLRKKQDEDSEEQRKGCQESLRDQFERIADKRTAGRIWGSKPPDLPMIKWLRIGVEELEASRRPYFSWMLYSYWWVEPGSIIAIVLLTTWQLGAWTLGALAAAVYVAYRVARWVADDMEASKRLLFARRLRWLVNAVRATWLRQIYRIGRHGVARLTRAIRPGGRWIHPVSYRWLFLMCGAVFLVGWDYSHGKSATGDTLWLLLVMPTFILSQSVGVTWVALSTLLAGASLLVIRLGLVTGEGAATWESVAPQLIWLWFLAFLLHILARYALEQHVSVRTLQRVQKAILDAKTGSLDERAVYRIVLRNLSLNWRHPFAHVFVREPDGAARCVEAIGPASHQVRDFRLPRGKGIIGFVAQVGRSRVENDVRREGSGYYLHPALAHTKAELTVPIRVFDREKAHAVLDVQSDMGGIFLGPDLMGMEILADYIGVVLEGVAMQRTNSMLRTLMSDLVRKGSSTRSVEEVLTPIAEAAREQLSADVVVLYGWDPRGKELSEPVVVGGLQEREVVLCYRPAPGSLVYRLLDAPVQYHFQEGAELENGLGEPLFRPEGRSEKDENSFVTREGIRARAILRLQDGEEAIGLMFINYRIARVFGDEEKQTMTALADLAALSLQLSQANRRLREVELERKQAALEYPKLGAEEADRLLSGEVPAWKLDKDGTIEAANGLAFWLWMALDDGELLGRNVFDVLGHPETMERIPVGKNRDFYTKKSGVNKRFSQLAGGHVGTFRAAMLADAETAAIYEAAEVFHDREWSYRLSIEAPDGDTAGLLTFETMVCAVERGDGDRGFIAIYRPIGEAVQVVRDAFSRIAWNGGRSSYVRYSRDISPSIEGEATNGSGQTGSWFDLAYVRQEALSWAKRALERLGKREVVASS